MQPCHVPLGVSLRDLKKDLNLHQTNNGEVFEVAHFKENDQHGKKKQKKKKKKKNRKKKKKKKKKKLYDN